MPFAPCSNASSASSGVSTPFTTTGIFVSEHSQSTVSHVTVAESSRETST